MRRLARAAGVAATVALACAQLHAQWPTVMPADVPRTADGQPDLNAPAPRTRDGKPDLSGVWRAGGPSRRPQGIPTGFSYPGTEIFEPQGLLVLPYIGIPRTDYGQRLFEERRAAQGRDNPRGLCLPIGIMQLHMTALPARYVQTPGVLVILYEVNGERREIFTDGRSLPNSDALPWWNGYSVGRWEGDVLVVETTNFRDGGWLDGQNPLTDAARFTERFRRTAYGRMEIDITIEDPKAYLKPFTVRWNQALVLGDDLMESVCENNQFPPALDRVKR